MNTIVISNYRNQDVVCGLIDNKLEHLSVVRQTQLHNIYVGRIDNIVKNIEGAFVRFGDGEIGYLPLKAVIGSCVLNREDLSKGPKCGDEVIVQVESEAIKTKKCRLTTYLCINSKYCVITLGRKGVGCSSKISEPTRKLLVEGVKAHYEELLDEFSKDIGDSSFGILIRTSAYQFAEDQTLLMQDIKDCLEKLISIYREAKVRTVYSCIYNELSSDDNEITVDTSNMEIEESTNIEPYKAYIQKAGSFIHNRNKELIKVTNDTGIYGIKSKIDELMFNKVYLKSGGFLIIEQLESFNAIDVNSGKAIQGKSNISLKLNLEAADEIMRQVRLRNLTGMILIDFINMDKEDYEVLIQHVKELCRFDTVHTNFIDITGLGIMELTRNKNDKSLKEILQ
ncbi:ribonuclease E/G [Butyrivibrio proteoclasticus]|uniref:ribonuclease E/G n=1 Tax=Butyrivibrio proteoclasticus TaxID=43305 RepID=UPI00047E9D90|nr:ribonuclease E/G [Butyrivibrio proteoclasticus]